MSRIKALTIITQVVFASCLALLGVSANADVLMQFKRMSDTVAVLSGSGSLGTYPGAVGNFNSIEMDNPFAIAPQGYANSSVMGSSNTMSAGGKAFNIAYIAGGSFTEWGFDGAHPFLYVSSVTGGYLPENSILSGSMELVLRDGSTFAPVGSSGYASWGAGIMPGGIVGTWQMLSSTGSMPAPISFDSTSISLPNSIGTSVSPKISLQGKTFTLDVPLFLDTILTGSTYTDLASSWIEAINRAWSSLDVKNQFGESFDFNVNAHFVSNQSDSISTIQLNGVSGSDNPPCRDPSILFGILVNPFADCPIPKVDNKGVMQMYSGQQHYCYGSLGLPRDCTSADGVAFASYLKSSTPAPLVLCGNSGLLSNSLYSNLMCLDSGGMSEITAVHEFGHILGLPDEYGKDQNLSDPFTPCYRTTSNPREGCAGGEDVGIMGDVAFPVQQRYFDFLFASLDSYTPGFNWTFGYSPTWNEGQQLPYDLPILGSFELSPEVNGTVPEPATIALFGVGLLGLGFIRRRDRIQSNSAKT